MFEESDELSFDRDLFKHANFDSDDFLIKYKQKVDLETLQNDLAAYSKELSTEVYDVISDNYGNFLKFTSELSHFEKSYKEFVEPFNALKNEIETVNSSLAECELQAQECIQEAIIEQENEDEQKYCQNFVQKLDDCELYLGENDLILNELQSNDEISHGNHGKRHQTLELTMDTANDLLDRLERCANEYGPLIFTRKTFPDNEQVSQRFEKMDNLVSKIIHQSELLFTNCINNYFNHDGRSMEVADVKILQRILMVYALINQYGEAENLFKTRCVRWNLQKVIKMENLENRETGVGKVYQDIYKFMAQQVAPLLQITGCDISELTAYLGLKNHNYIDIYEKPVPGFDFLKNSIWPEIVRRFESTMSPIYAPANPDAFHKNYADTLVFMAMVESVFSTQREVIEFRKLSSYHDFMVKPWHLSVYYQIRFQELAGVFEEALSNEFFKLNSTHLSKNVRYYLNVNSLLEDSMMACWDNSRIYLPALCHKFWKLSLQIVSRHIHYLKHDIAQQPRSVPSEIYGFYLLADIKTLLKGLPRIFEKFILPNLKPLLKNAQHIDAIDDGENFGIEKLRGIFLDEAQNDYGNRIIPDLIQAMIGRYLLDNFDSVNKRINDIPRIYRHTKRMPKEPSDYVSEMVQPFDEFVKKLDENFDTNDTEISALRAQTLKKGFEVLTLRYTETVQELLTNVHRTEESLLRLKKVKGLLSTNPPPSKVVSPQPDAGSGGREITSRTSYATDGAKIRGQLRLDVELYGKLITKLGVPLNEIVQHQTLLNALEDPAPLD